MLPEHGLLQVRLRALIRGPELEDKQARRSLGSTELSPRTGMRRRLLREPLGLDGSKQGDWHHGMEGTVHHTHLQTETGTEVGLQEQG